MGQHHRQKFFALSITLLAFLPAGCDVANIFGDGYDLPPSADVPEGDWPKLADTDFDAANAALPDPVQGQIITETLTADAAAMNARAEKLAGSGLNEQDSAALDAASGRKRQN